MKSSKSSGRELKWRENCWKRNGRIWGGVDSADLAEEKWSEVAGHEEVRGRLRNGDTELFWKHWKKSVVRPFLFRKTKIINLNNLTILNYCNKLIVYQSSCSVNVWKFAAIFWSNFWDGPLRFLPLSIVRFISTSVWILSGHCIWNIVFSENSETFSDSIS
jgi:hypothetical protein